MTRPLIMAAPNGTRRVKADHPAIPITIFETVATAMACRAAGADALHLHVRDASGHHKSNFRPRIFQMTGFSERPNS